MVKSLFGDIIETVFGFLIAFIGIVKRPLKAYELAIKPNGFRIGLSTFIWVLIFDIWIGKTILSSMEYHYYYEEKDNQEVLLDFGDTMESRESKTLGFVSSPVIRELVVFVRLTIAILAILPAAFLIIGRKKDETAFRNFISLNLLLSSFTALVSLILMVVVLKLAFATDNLKLLVNFYFIQYLILGLLTLTMLFVFYSNWKNMFPNTKRWRIRLAYFVWLICGLMISGIYKVVTGT